MSTAFRKPRGCHVDNSIKITEWGRPPWGWLKEADCCKPVCFLPPVLCLSGVNLQAGRWPQIQTQQQSLVKRSQLGLSTTCSRCYRYVNARVMMIHMTSVNKSHLFLTWLVFFLLADVFFSVATCLGFCQRSWSCSHRFCSSWLLLIH